MAQLPALSGLVQDILESQQDHGSAQPDPINTILPLEHLQLVRDYCELVDYAPHPAVPKPFLRPLDEHFSPAEL